MNGPDYLTAAAALFSAFTFGHLIPLGTLLGMATLFAWVLFKAQKGENFDAAEFLRDDDKKLSAARLFAFICCMTHTWVVFVRTLNDKITVEELALYAVTWSGSLVLMQGIAAWKGVRSQPEAQQ